MSGAHGVPSRGAPVGWQDPLTLRVGGRVLTGWQRVNVSRPLAGIPASFDLEVTERFPATADVDVQPGQQCTVWIGRDLVITGYVDRYAATINASMHSIRISGRSKSEDLIDCSAVFDDMDKPGFQAIGGSTLDITRKLAAPYDIPVRSTAGDGTQIQQFNILLGESPWDVIDRITRYSQMLVYDQPDGSIMLARVGTESMSSGFAIGQNVEQGSVTFSMDGRFSEYEGHLTSVLTFGTEAGTQVPGVGEVVKDDGVSRFLRDDGKPRRRKRYVISEQFVPGRNIVYDRAVWERNKRRGSSYQFDVVCDSWRDSAGKLWEVNKLAPIQAAALKLSNARFLISSVTFLRDETGQHASLTLVPPETYDVEPTGLLSGFTTLSEAERANNPTAKQYDQVDTQFQP